MPAIGSVRSSTAPSPRWPPIRRSVPPSSLGQWPTTLATYRISTTRWDPSHIGDPKIKRCTRPTRVPVDRRVDFMTHGSSLLVPFLPPVRVEGDTPEEIAEAVALFVERGGDDAETPGVMNMPQSAWLSTRPDVPATRVRQVNIAALGSNAPELIRGAECHTA